MAKAVLAMEYLIYTNLVLTVWNFGNDNLSPQIPSMESGESTCISFEEGSRIWIVYLKLIIRRLGE